MTVSPTEVPSVDQMARDADLENYSCRMILYGAVKAILRLGMVGWGDQPSGSDNESDLNNRAEGSKYRDLLNKKLKRLLCFCCNVGWSVVDY